jgi:hypothetical protein
MATVRARYAYRNYEGDVRTVEVKHTHDVEATRLALEVILDTDVAVMPS